MSLSRRSNLFASLVAAIVLVGCSSGGMESQVTGRVTLDGKGVGPGTTTFAPQVGGTNPAIGAIDPSGSFTLKTNRTEGLKPGKYKVSVSVFEPPVGQPGERLMGSLKLITPEKYSSIETSGLEYDVAPGSNTINIDLPSK